MGHAEIHTNLINPYILSEHMYPINLSEKKVLEHHKTVNSPRRAPEVGKQLFGLNQFLTKNSNFEKHQIF